MKGSRQEGKERKIRCYRCGYYGTFKKKKDLVYCPNCGKIIYGKRSRFKKNNDARRHVT